MRARCVAVFALVVAFAASAWAETPVDAARALVARYHKDPAGLDNARDLLESALATEPKVETMVMLSYVHFLIGDVRATTAEASGGESPADSSSGRPSANARERRPGTQLTHLGAKSP